MEDFFLFDLIFWIFAGIIATIAMSIFQLTQLGYYEKKSIPEFDQNAHLLSRATGKTWEEVYWYGLPLHFGHGILGAIFFGLLVEFNLAQGELLYGIGYGIFLWIILLIIHKPITRENIFAPFPNSRLLSSFISHMIYGIILSLI
jgi:hypothetical protein